MLCQAMQIINAIDIPLLAAHFAASYAKEMNKRVSLAPRALELLKQQPWRGNVRELKNVIERAAVFHPPSAHLHALRQLAHMLQS